MKLIADDGREFQISAVESVKVEQGTILIIQIPEGPMNRYEAAMKYAVERCPDLKDKVLVLPDTFKVQAVDIYCGVDTALDDSPYMGVIPAAPEVP
jgi:hypothetical protein